MPTLSFRIRPHGKKTASETNDAQHVGDVTLASTTFEDHEPHHCVPTLILRERRMFVAFSPRQLGCLRFTSSLT